jgi:deoxyadenosine/deoxycytidine kinase
MQKLIIIEGNISAGKSTLTRELAQALGYRVFLEPTSTNPFLADFYRDPKRYALRMQVYLLRRRFHTYVAAVQHMLETGQVCCLWLAQFDLPDWLCTGCGTRSLHF